MTKESVISYITQNNDIEKCIERGSMKLIIENTGVIFLFREDGVEYYYETPFDPQKDYTAVNEFCKIAIPYITEILKKHRINTIIK